MKRTFRNKINTMIAKMLPTLSAFLKRDPKLWVFGAWQGMMYSDNSKYLFEYVRKAHPEYKCIWITRSEEVFAKLQKDGIECYKANSAKGILTVMRSGAAFETEGNGDISFFLNPKKTLTIQLWHGVAPKKANWSSFETSHWHDQYWMVSSEQNKKTMQDLMGMDNDHVYITGYPRNDTFYIEQNRSPLVAELEERYPNCKKVIYMPTHRNFGAEGPKVKIEDLSQADRFFRDNNIVFVFKPHFHELKYYAENRAVFKNIIIANQDAKYSDVYSYINDFDMLISDYSSIIYDFTCSGKPIVLFPYDADSFNNTDAGLFDYFYTLPVGPFCYTWNDVLFSVKNLLEKDDWKEKREKCREVFHPYKDGLNRERVFNCVKGLLERKKQEDI